MPQKSGLHSLSLMSVLLSMAAAFTSCNTVSEADYNYQTYTATIQVIDRITDEPINEAWIIIRVREGWKFSDYWDRYSSNACSEGKIAYGDVTDQIVRYCTNDSGQAFINARHVNAYAEKTFDRTYACGDWEFTRDYTANSVGAEGYDGYGVSITLVRGTDYPLMHTFTLEKSTFNTKP